MKQCPTCNRTYADESLTFCLADGSLLSAPYDPQATQRIPPARPTNARTEVLPTNLPVPEIAKPKRNPLIMYLVIGVLALVAGGGIVALLTSRTKDVSSPAPATSSPAAATSSPAPPASNSSNISSLPSASPITPPSQNSEPEAIREAPTKSEPTPPTTGKVPPPTSGTWFVILGSFPKNEYDRAAQRLKSIQAQGHDASIIDTDNYPGFKGGLWAVVMGPYSKSYANNLAAQMKSVRPDAYAKSGW